eukprot:4982548-Prymnesium_polylepis.1
MRVCGAGARCASVLTALPSTSRSSSARTRTERLRSTSVECVSPSSRLCVSESRASCASSASACSFHLAPADRAVTRGRAR